MKNYLLIIFIGLLVIILIKLFRAPEPISRPESNEIKKLDSLIGSLENLSDSLSNELRIKDSLLSIQENNIVIIKKVYDKKINDIAFIGVDSSIKFFSNWLSEKDSI